MQQQGRQEERLKSGSHGLKQLTIRQKRTNIDIAEKTDMGKTEAVNLKNHIQYSANSIVSKTIIDKKVGTLTLFAFDTGQNLSEHTAPFDAVVQILDGEAEISVGGELFKVGSGQMIIMPANVPHAVKASQRFKMLLTMIRS